MGDFFSFYINEVGGVVDGKEKESEVTAREGDVRD